MKWKFDFNVGCMPCCMKICHQPHVKVNDWFVCVSYIPLPSSPSWVGWIMISCNLCCCVDTSRATAYSGRLHAQGDKTQVDHEEGSVPWPRSSPTVLAMIHYSGRWKHVPISAPQPTTTPITGFMQYFRSTSLTRLETGRAWAERKLRRTLDESYR